jgi:deoxyribose-phosphate aldolase
VCTVVGFPLGANTVATKVFETIDAVQNGADEIDMVINVGKAKAGDFDYLQDEIRAVVDAAKDANESTFVKVILETCYLDDFAKIKICEIAKEEGADAVKTSTGFGDGGATVEDITLMRETVGPIMCVKASGGVKTLEDAKKMIEAGATRLGTSSGVTIAKKLEGK